MTDVNTTERWSSYCRAESPDGRKCSLYSPHEGLHKPEHGTESDRFESGKELSDL